MSPLFNVVGCNRKLQINECSLTAHSPPPKNRTIFFGFGCTKILTIVLSTRQKTNPFPLFAPPPSADVSFGRNFRSSDSPAPLPLLSQSLPYIPPPVFKLRVMCIFRPHLCPRYAKKATFRI